MKKRKKWWILIVLLPLLLLFALLQNNWIGTTKLTVTSAKLPETFDQYKIVQLSDLHQKRFGKNQQFLLKKIEKIKPDIIVFTGDLIDANRQGDENSLLLMEQLVALAPTYYVTGNHEWWSGNYLALEKKLIGINVRVLRNEHVQITHEGASIVLIGIDDPATIPENEEMTTSRHLLEATEGMREDAIKILLAHRPEQFPLYAATGIDFIFSGHAHGGQFRLPFVGGFVAPNQGFFPKYTTGTYQIEEATMVVNRGLGNSVIPLRLFNRPEIISVILQHRSLDQD